MNIHEIAGTLREIRLRRGLGQSDLGTWLGMSAGEVSRIERGRRRFPTRLLSPWCAILGIREELIFWDDHVADGGLNSASGVLDEDCLAVLALVAATLPDMPAAARVGLTRHVRVWAEVAGVAIEIKCLGVHRRAPNPSTRRGREEKVAKLVEWIGEHQPTTLVAAYTALGWSRANTSKVATEARGRGLIVKRGGRRWSQWYTADDVESEVASESE